ncbi:acyltransferase family protein [Klebsiella aerogenes]
MASIQILRFIAAALVVIHHLSFKLNTPSYPGHFLQLGASGVDMFFIISGFIMMLISTRENEPVNFIKKRVKRIYPMYWLYTSLAIFILLIAPELIKPSEGKDGITVLGSLTLIPFYNQEFALKVGWSLTYEMFFYLIFATSLFLKRNIAITSSLIIIAFYTTSLFTNFFLIDYLGRSIALEFILGIIAYKLYINQKLKNNFILISILSLASFVFLIFTEINNSTLDPAAPDRRFAMWGIPMFFIFVWFISLEESIKSFKIHKALSTLGDASFSIYLSHLFVVSACVAVFKKLPILHGINFYVATLIIATISIAFGYLSYRFIEKPKLLERIFPIVKLAFKKNIRHNTWSVLNSYLTDGEKYINVTRHLF